MIVADQFTNLPDDLLFVFSSRDDGSVLDRTSGETHAPDIVDTRRKFCAQVGIDYDHVVFQSITYNDEATYDRIVEVDELNTTKFVDNVTADALFTKAGGVGLFLPVADCIATVLYDPKRRLMAQLHMGRHSSLTNILDAMVARFMSEGSHPSDILVWMAPAATKETYAMDYFDYANDPTWTRFVEHRDDGYYLDLQGYNRATLERLGVASGHITISSINTMENGNYFSHSRGDTSGRFAAIAMMR